MLTQLFLTSNDWITGATCLAALGCFYGGRSVHAYKQGGKKEE